MDIISKKYAEIKFSHNGVEYLIQQSELGEDNEVQKDGRIFQTVNGEQSCNNFKLKTYPIIINDSEERIEQNFYIVDEPTTKFAIKLNSADGRISNYFRVYTKKDIDFVKLLVDNDIIVIPPFSNVPTDPVMLKQFEKIYDKDQIFVNTENLTKSPNLGDVINFAYPSFSNEFKEWDILLAIPYKGMGVGDKLIDTYYETRKNPNAPKDKEYVFLRKIENPANDKEIYTLEKEIDCSKKIILIDDILGRGKAIEDAYTFCKSKGYNDIEYFTIFDMMRKKDGKPIKQILAEKGIHGKCALDLETVVDVVFTFDGILNYKGIKPNQKILDEIEKDVRKNPKYKLKRWFEKKYKKYKKNFDEPDSGDGWKQPTIEEFE